MVETGLASRMNEEKEPTYDKPNTNWSALDCRRRVSQMWMQATAKNMVQNTLVKFRKSIPRTPVRQFESKARSKGISLMRANTPSRSRYFSRLRVWRQPSATRKA